MRTKLLAANSGRGAQGSPSSRRASCFAVVLRASRRWVDAQIRTRQLRAVRDTQDAALVKETEAMVSLLEERTAAKRGFRWST